MSGKQFFVLLIVVAIAAFAGGMAATRIFPSSAPQKTVSAQEYHLLDAAGVRRASFEVSITDEPSLVLRDQEGKRRAVLSFSESGEALWSQSLTAPDSVHLLTHDGRQPFLDRQ
jgi:hypothetical protein